jgi:uncharacterized membrane protein YbaN (DUF454 family)
MSSVNLRPEQARSEQVVDGFKKHKLAVSALRRVHELLQEFERDRAIDRRLALIGLAIVLALIGVSIWLLPSGSGVTLP